MFSGGGCGGVFLFFFLLFVFFGVVGFKPEKNKRKFSFLFHFVRFFCSICFDSSSTNQKVS